MADLIVSPLVNLVKQKVADCLKYQYELHLGVEEKLKKLESDLNEIVVMANAADKLDLKEQDEGLKKWKMKLKVAAEEASDVLDEFEYLCLKRQAEGDGADDEVHCFPLSFECIKSFNWHGFIRSLYLYAKRYIQSTGPLERLRSTQSKLDELDFSAEKFLKVVEIVKATTDREPHRQDGHNRETGSSVVEPEWVGRRGVLEEIINNLLEEPVSHGGRIPVLAVVSHGGMGKTTLAQHVFNDSKVKAHFDMRMWAYVSEDFNVKTITRRIIESAASNMTCSNTESLETLQQKLKDTLNKSKRFLLVLDDVWYGQDKFLMEEQWNKLCSPLAEVGGKGSKILLTSRTPEVKDLPGAPTPIELKGLEQEECWSIIQRSAFPGVGNLDSYQHLAEIGRQIARKVHGSPLAAKAVGSILRNKLNLRSWFNILNSELTEIKESNVMTVLKLSYQHLPPPLRQCFAYCSLFPKGHIFDINKLVRMWVAHGYITEEDTGRRYFNDLLLAGFFTRQFSVVMMHDLMSDLARFVSKDEFLFIEAECDIPETVRHLSLRTDYLPNLSKKVCNLSNLQSLITISNGSRDLDDEVVKDVLRQLRRVRVLDLCWCPVKELPDDIGHLVHLRYLDLSHTGISKLPESLWRLYHLQVLSIDTKMTPTEKLNQLVKLRFLCSNQDLKLTWIKGLKSLEVLEKGLVVEEGRGGEIGNLKALNELRDELTVKDLDYVESGAAAREADLCGKKWLQKLDLRWKWSRGACSPEVAADVLEGLQPPCSLEQLRIFYYPGMVCPNWMSNIWLTNLQSLELANIPRVRKLSQEAFPSLKSLKMDDMKELEEWDGSVGFPCLEVLEIENCPKIREFPTLAPTLKELSIIRFGNLTSLRGEGLLQNLHHLRNLKKLTIVACEQLVSLPDGGFRDLISLKSLVITFCPNLTCVAPKQDLGRGLLPSSLEELMLSHLCDETLSRFLHGLSNLSKLEVFSSPCLKSMPSQEELALLTSLKELTIRDCQSLPVSALDNLPALPPLKWLNIYQCPTLTPSGLEDLPALVSGDDGECMASGPFSLTLERLWIDDPLMLINVPVLKSLTSVQRVNIRNASQLFPSPEMDRWFLQNGTSLKELEIGSAMELQSLPELPKSLDKLEIRYCNEEFKKRYEKDIGPDWHKIQHIKYINIRGLMDMLQDIFGD